MEELAREFAALERRFNELKKHGNPRTLRVSNFKRGNHVTNANTEYLNSSFMTTNNGVRDIRRNKRVYLIPDLRRGGAVSKVYHADGVIALLARGGGTAKSPHTRRRFTADDVRKLN